MMISQPPRTSRLDPIIEALLIALLAFMPAAFGAVNAWSEGVAMTLGAAIAVCLTIRAVTSASHEVRFSPAWIAVALFITVAAAQLLPLPMLIVRKVAPQTAALKTDLLEDLPDAKQVLARETISFYPLGTRGDLRIVLLAATVFAAVVIVYRDDRRMHRLLVGVALIGGAFAVLAVAQDLSRTTQIYWRVPIGELARSGPFANHSHYGQFMNLSIGCALALLLARLTESSRLSFAAVVRRTWWLAAIIIVGLATISLSLTRGGTIAILASGAVATLVLLATRSLRQMAGVLVVLLLAAMAFLFYHGFDRVYARMLEPGIGSRAQMLRDTFAMTRMFPTFGVGLGAYDWIFPMFDRSYVPSTAEYVENEYVQALVDTGPLGLAAVIVFVGVIAMRYLRAVRNRDHERIGLAAVGLGYGLVAVMVHSLSDFGQHLPAIACLSAVTCGLLFNLGERRVGRTIRFGRGVGVVALIVVCAISGWALVDATRAWRSERQWEHVDRLATALRRKNWKAPDEEFNALLSAASNAIATEPDNVHHRYWAAVYRWHWISGQRDADTGRIIINDRTVAAAQRVVGELNDARAICPTFGLLYTMLGQIELRFLDRPIGYSHIESGYRLSRNDVDASFVAGQADAQRGHFDQAEEKFHEAMLLDPEIIGDIIDVYLYQVDRPDLAAAAIGSDFRGLLRLRDALRKNAQWKNLAEQVDRHAVDVLDAETRQPGAPAWKFAIVGTYHQEHERYDQAEKYFSRSLQGEPNNLYWRVRHAEVLQKLGRTREAIEEARLVLQMHPTAPEAQAIVKQLTGGGGAAP